MHILRNRLLFFFALSCAITWFGNLGNYFWPSDYWMAPMNPFGPLIAAPIVIASTEGRRGLGEWWRKIWNFRAPLPVYAAAFFIPLSIIVASFGLTVVLGAKVAALPAYSWVEVLLITTVVPFFGPIPEELSFRGYGLERLQRTISPLVASLWIGLGVMVWHLPLLITGELPLTVLVPLAGVAVVYGWLYRAGKSVWPLVILHAQLNVCSALVTGPMMPDRHDQATYLAILGVFYLAWAALLAIRTGPSLAGSRANPGMPMPV
jgi:membrane protease YdiL (CAAX protease family)